MIFISYRRDDAAAEASRLRDALVSVFGAPQVFMDVIDIQPGRDFREIIKEYVEASDALLVIIGRNWLKAADSSGKRRVDNPEDFVRHEVGGALKRKVPVLPILVQNAAIPLVDELPADLKDLVYRHASELTHERWDSDFKFFLTYLKRIPNIARGATGVPPEPPPPAPRDPSPMPPAQKERTPTRDGRGKEGRGKRLFIVILAIAALVCAFFALFPDSPPGPRPPSFDTMGETTLLGTKKSPSTPPTHVPPTSPTHVPPPTHVQPTPPTTGGHH